MDFNNKKSIYLQIVDYFLERILRLELKENDRIASVREIAVRLEVNPNTVMRSYSYLQDKDIIFNKRGIGYFIAVGAFDKTLDLKKEEFLKEEVPSFIKMMHLLKMQCSDIENLQNNLKN